MTDDIVARLRSYVYDTVYNPLQALRVASLARPSITLLLWRSIPTARARAHDHDERHSIVTAPRLRGRRQMTDDIVVRLRERTTLRYAGNCKCGSCQLVPRELIQRIIVALDERDAKPADEIERLRAALLKISELEPEGPIGNDCMAVSYASETARVALEGEVSND